MPSIKFAREVGKLFSFECPARGPIWNLKSAAYPREEYWDPLLKYTNTPGIHYADYPAIANFVCPEWSHLQPKDVLTFTNELVRILRDQKGWEFANKATAYK